MPDDDDGLLAPDHIDWRYDINMHEHSPPHIFVNIHGEGSSGTPIQVEVPGSERGSGGECGIRHVA